MTFPLRRFLLALILIFTVCSHAYSEPLLQERTPLLAPALAVAATEIETSAPAIVTTNDPATTGGYLSFDTQGGVCGCNLETVAETWLRSEDWLAEEPFESDFPSKSGAIPAGNQAIWRTCCTKLHPVVKSGGIDLCGYSAAGYFVEAACYALAVSADGLGNTLCERLWKLTTTKELNKERNIPCTVSTRWTAIYTALCPTGGITPD